LDGFVSVNLRIRLANRHNLSSNYLDDVSISIDNTHIWSFAAGCSCESPEAPGFIIDDFACDRVEEAQSQDDLLRDFQQCNTNSHWSHKTLLPTTTHITVRICRDQHRNDEDLGLKTLEIYIQQNNSLLSRLQCALIQKFNYMQLI